MPETGGSDATAAQRIPPEINTNVPQSARVYDYWLGGKDHFPADRALGDASAEALPTIRTQVRAQRAFLGRAVRYLARDAGVRQFLDIGTGIPSAGNVHDVAQEIAPESRVLYVDNDPIVLAHARALMSGTPQGSVAFIQADLREPEAILGDPAVAGTLDLAEPVGLVLVGVMHHLRDDDDPRRIVATLVDALAPGSYLVLCDGTNTSQAGVQAQDDYDQSGAIPYRLRSPEQVAGFFAGLELVDPGVVSCPRWRPDPADGPPAETDAFGGVGRKP